MRPPYAYLFLATTYDQIMLAVLLTWLGLA